MAFGRIRALVARSSSRPSPSPKDTGLASDSWMQSVPAPDVREGGESMWEAWQEESARMELAFADTQPSDLMPAQAAAAPCPGDRRTVEDVMAIARRNNRVCPRPLLWSALYALLDGEHHPDLRPPPNQAATWPAGSSMQRRLHLREHIEWADRHGKLAETARFIESLAEPDWVHTDET